MAYQRVRRNPDLDDDECSFGCCLPKFAFYAVLVIIAALTTVWGMQLGLLPRWSAQAWLSVGMAVTLVLMYFVHPHGPYQLDREKERLEAALRRKADKV